MLVTLAPLADQQPAARRLHTKDVYNSFLQF